MGDMCFMGDYGQQKSWGCSATLEIMQIVPSSGCFFSLSSCIQSPFLFLLHTHITAQGGSRKIDIGGGQVENRIFSINVSRV